MTPSAWDKGPAREVLELREQLARAYDRIRELEARHAMDRRALEDAWGYARSILPARQATP